MNDEFDEISAPELTADEEALLEEMPALTGVGQTRRTFLGQTIAGSLGLFALDLLAQEKALAALSPSPDAVFAAETAVENLVKVALKVNGVDENTGARFARRAARRAARAARADRLEEGLRPGPVRRLHRARRRAARPVVPHAGRHRARARRSRRSRGWRRAINCTRCRRPSSSTTASSAATARRGRSARPSALLDEARRGDVSHVTEDVSATTTRLTDDEIRERMSGNICRCGAYPEIVAAIQEVHSGKQTAQTWRFVDERTARPRAEGGRRCDRLSTCARPMPNAAARAVAANPQAKFLAGGTNLLDLMKEDVERPNELVDLDAPEARRDQARRAAASPSARWRRTPTPPTTR